MGKPPTFHTKMITLTDSEALEPSQFQGVHFTLSDEASEIMETLSRWFVDSNEVILVDEGTTAAGLSFIILEWEACTIPSAFLEVLEQDDRVSDYSVYLRDETYEEID
jgi:hypothetical protein